MDKRSGHAMDTVSLALKIGHEAPDGLHMTKPTTSHKEIHLRSNNRLPLYRSINSIAIITDYARKYGIASKSLLEGSGIRSHDLQDPEILITPRQEMMVFRKIIALIPDQKLGLDVGRNYNISANGKVAIPAIFCNTFLDCIRLMFRYIDVTLSYFRYELSVKGDLAVLRKEELIDLGDLRRFVTDRELMSVYMMSAGALGSPMALREIRLAYPKPDNASCYQETFHCPVKFDAGENLVSFENSYLSRPLPMANPLARHTYERECRRVYLRMKDVGSTLDKIKQELLIQEDGIPSLEQLARRLNISPRTLRRHLSTEGTSYKNLVRDMRREKAMDLLDRTDCPIERIAIELGYSDVPNFYHAFKKWTGVTPSEYRNKKYE
ncbi:MAG TPA: AraC family transcriptional regulator [Deltaproteobacteria bacterium]|nr:AraC family transcriptional regulator [Deltaproteobacteria bacterium]